MNFFQKHISGICLTLSLLIFSGVGFGIYSHYHPKSFGAIPQTPAQFETSLSIPQGTSDTTMTLASGTLGNGATLSGYYCFTVDSNTALNEYECGTASTTSPTLITGLTRGVDPQYGTTSIPSLIYSHRVGADVRITDYPFSTIVSGILNGNIGITNPLIYSGVSTSTLFSNPSNLVDYAALTSVALQGSVNATTTTQGLVQFATPLQTAQGVYQGSTGAYLVPQGSIFASSSSSTTLVPVTQTNGILNQNFLGLSQNFTFTGNLTNTGTTTLAATTTSPLILDGIPYIFPSTQGIASSTWINNGSGKLTSIIPFSYATSSTSTIATSWTNSNTNLVSATTTLPVAERVMVNAVIPGLQYSANANTCSIALFIDGSNVGTMATQVIPSVSGDSGRTVPASFTFITSQLTAATHSFTLVGLSVGSGTCSITNFEQLSVFNAGN